MAQPHSPPQAPLTGSLDALQLQEPTQLPDLSLFGPGQYPESVAFWHTSPNQPLQPILPAPSASDSSISPTQQPASQPISDQKKHKRTRSGCFTCRSRRIKCDEARPICDRCRKGNRDCIYPSTGSSSKASPRSSAKPRGHRPPSQGSDSSGLVEPDDFRALEPIVDEDEEEAESMGSGTRLSPTTGTGPARSNQRIPRRYSTQSLKKGRTKQSEAEVAGSHKENSSSPSTETSSKFESRSVRSASVSLEPFALPSIAHLQEDLRFYVAFHQDFLTHRHYFLNPTSDRFVHHTIVDFALQYEPLLYAIVGFSAYHHCVHTRTGKLYNFLKYYDTALKLLRKSLASGEPHWEATLITVLMLTTFEEFVGDWVNLIDHHQAAHALMRELLTPESVNMNEVHSHIFLWYARFDVVAGILGGNETILAREWYISKEEYDAEQAASNPGDPQKQLALAASINRRFGLDMASLYAKLSRGMIPYEEFIVQNELLGQTLERTKSILDTFNDSEYRVLSYPHSRPLTEDDVVDPYVPGGLHHGPLWEINYAWIDYIATKSMYKYQSLLSTQQSSMAELGSLAVELCRLIESVERWPEKENGYVFAFKNSMGMASMFLPMHPKYIMWSRGKFALLEQNGYINPPKFRAGLAALWRLPEINEWWLPNGEGYPEIIREVRSMTEEGINNPRDKFRESVRDMKTLFWKISLDDTESENSPSPAGPTP